MANTKITSNVISDDLALGGNPTTTTQSAGNNTTRLATTAFVSTAVAGIVDSAPDALNTLNELAAALGDSANFASETATLIGAKLPKAGGTMTGELNMNTQDITNIDTIGSAHFSTTANVNSSGDGGAQIPNGKRLGFDQQGTRSWSQYAAGGNLLFASGDGNGAVQANNFTGVTLTLTGALVGTSGTLTGDLTIESATSTKPHLKIKNTNANDAAPQLQFIKDSSSPADGDELGRIYMFGDDDAGNAFEGILIRGIANDVSNGSEDSSLEMFTYAAGSQKSTLALSSGKVGIGTDDPAAKLDIRDGGGSSDPTLSLVSNTSTAYNHSINALNPNLTADEANIIVVGKEGATNNSGYLGFKYASDGSNDNLISLGHWGNNFQLNVTGHGNVGIGTESPSTALEVSGQLSGGLGAATTAGTGDYNHSTNARAGMGHTLLLGTATNGPGGSGAYFHVVNFEYTTKDGSGNMTQLAIPYYGSSSIYIRQRYQGNWSSWGTV